MVHEFKKRDHFGRHRQRKEHGVRYREETGKTRFEIPGTDSGLPDAVVNSPATKSFTDQPQSDAFGSRLDETPRQIRNDENIALQKSLTENPEFSANDGLTNKAITGETLPEIQGENGIAKSLAQLEGTTGGVAKMERPQQPELHGDTIQQASEQDEAKEEEEEFTKLSRSQEATIKKFGSLLPLGDVARPDLYLQDQQHGASAHDSEGASLTQDAPLHEEPHIERKQYDDDYSSSNDGHPFKKDQLPSSSDNKTTPALKIKEDQPNSSAASPLDNNIVNTTVPVVADDKPHGLNIEISKSKSISFDNPSGVKLSTSTGSVKNQSVSVEHKTKRGHIARKKSELIIKRLRKTLKGLHKEKDKTEKGGKKNAVVVNRPDVIYHPPPEIIHRPPIIVNRPPLVIQRPSIVYHQPPVIVHRPPVMYQQPPLIFHQPSPHFSQPIVHQQNQFVTVPQLQHIGSHVSHHGSFVHTPLHSFGYLPSARQTFGTLTSTNQVIGPSLTDGQVVGYNS
eukprot:TCONS_00024867-protein